VCLFGGPLAGLRSTRCAGSLGGISPLIGRARSRVCNSFQGFHGFFFLSFFPFLLGFTRGFRRTDRSLQPIYWTCTTRCGGFPGPFRSKWWPDHSWFRVASQFFFTMSEKLHEECTRFPSRGFCLVISISINEPYDLSLPSYLEHRDTFYRQTLPANPCAVPRHAAYALSPNCSGSSHRTSTTHVG
jgi:hypothetical protein